MKLFNSARLKLTAIYTAILLLISISFSIVIAVTAAREIDRPFDRPPAVIRNIDQQAMDDIFRQRAESARLRIALVLTFVNVGVLILGLAGSYFLARWTLRPIEKAMADQARFVSDASHELRTPLAAIAMENEVILRESKSNAKNLRLQIQSNLDEIGKLQKLTNYLLELNQDETIEFSRADLAAIARDAIKINAKAAAVKKIIIKNQIQPQPIVTNANALTEILSILINNAVKYSPEKSEISIAKQLDEILVIDQGSGLAEVDLPHIFDRFYRAEKSRTSEGYGLGLALARSLAERIGAKITAANNREKGATFSVKPSAKFQPTQQK